MNRLPQMMEIRWYPRGGSIALYEDVSRYKMLENIVVNSMTMKRKRPKEAAEIFWGLDEFDMRNTVG